MSVTYVCKGCECETTLTDVVNVPPDELCPPCHFFGPGWEDDKHLAGVVDQIQEGHKAH